MPVETLVVERATTVSARRRADERRLFLVAVALAALPFVATAVALVTGVNVVGSARNGDWPATTTFDIAVFLDERPPGTPLPPPVAPEATG